MTKEGGGIQMRLGLLKKSNDEKDFIQTFQALYQRDYRKWVGYGLKQGMEQDRVEAAIQEMAVGVLKAAKRLTELSSQQLSAYVMTSLKNALRDQWKLREKDSFPLQVLPGREDPANRIIDLLQPDPQERVMDVLEYEGVSRMVDRLPEQYKRYLYLRYYLNFSNQEISRMMDLPENYVRMIKHRAVAMLRKLLEQEEKGGNYVGGSVRR